MRETHFIQQNKGKWDEFEEKFEKETDPEKASNLFIQITDDLSYARTYYPNRSVKIYLNNIAQKVFQSIYKNKVRRRQKFKLFWSDELPQKMYESRKQLLFTTILFTVAFFIGIFSSMHDPNFAKFILGEDYVSMTETNIEKDDPMAVYKNSSQTDMVLAITFNNLQVAFLTLVFGIFFGVGTAYFILYNGIMVGTFQYFFIERGLFQESFLTIWVHGALEISAIVIAGTAGITLGRGLLFPGTLTRLQSFRINGLRAVQIFLGITPIIILAGINESYLTRYTDTPDIVRGVLIFLEFSFMLFYFVIYPARKAKTGFNVSRKSDEIPVSKIPEVQFSKIKSNGEIFADSFSIFRKFFTPIFTIIFFIALAYTGILIWKVIPISEIYHRTGSIDLSMFVEAFSDIQGLLNYSNVMRYNENLGIYTSGSGFPLFALNVIALTLILSLALSLIQQARAKSASFSYRAYGLFILKRGLPVLLLSALLHVILFVDTDFFLLLFFVAIPIVIIMLTDMIKQGRIQGSMLNKTRYYFKQFLPVQLLYLPLLLFSLMMALISHTVITYFNVELIKWNIPFDPFIYELIQDFSITFFLILTVFFQIAMVAVNMSLMYFSYNEVETADDLQERLQQLSQPKTGTAIP